MGDLKAMPIVLLPRMHSVLKVPISAHFSDWHCNYIMNWQFLSILVDSSLHFECVQDSQEQQQQQLSPS